MSNINFNSYEYYKKSSVSGVKWTGFAEVLIRLFQFAVTIALARLLTPEDFGFIALALIAVKFIQLIIDFGIASALIQKTDASNKDYHFSFTFLLILSFIFTVVLVLFAMPVARLLGNAEIAPLIRYLSLVIILSGLNVLPRIILNRELKFKEIAMADLFSALGFGLVTVLFAVLLQSVWCFVVGVIAEQVVAGTALWLYARWKPRLFLSLPVLKSMFNFSSSVFGTRLLNFMNLNALNIFIQKFFGSMALGYFSLAYQVIDLPTQRIAKNIMKVMYPVLSKLQKQPAEYENLLLNSLFMIVLVILPFFSVLYLLAEPFVLLFYGAKWLAAVPYIKILCVAGFVRSMWTGISVVAMSLGRPGFELKLNLANFILLIPGIVIFSRWGMLAAVSFFTVLLTALFIYGQWQVFSWLQIPFTRVLKIFRVPVLATLIIFLLIEFLVKFQLVVFQQHIALKFFIMSVFAGSLYLALLFILDRKTLAGLAKFILKS